MGDLSVIILLVALLLDWALGEPDILWSRIPHPIVVFGKAVRFADKTLNNPSDTHLVQYRKGSLAIACLLLFAFGAAVALNKAFESLDWIGVVAETFIVFVLLAQRSLHDHVLAVADGLSNGGIEGGRSAVAMIVGRDPSQLDASGVARASIESLAENFSDGVVAPAFWYLVFGLPGLIVYKMINTADSMIAYKSETYLWFGRSAAQIDDLANWLPARFSAGIIALGVWAVRSFLEMKHSLRVAMQASNLHRSPNAGWPEAAMAGGVGIALGGPRVYAHESVQQAWINGAGKRNLGVSDIKECLSVFSASCYVLWAIVVVLAFVL